MTLRDEIAADAVRVFCNQSDFAEQVIYRPHRYVGEQVREPRIITAVVIREQIATLVEDVETVAPMFMVHVANDSATGISSEELDIGGDMIEVPQRDGKQPERRTITRLIEQDHGMLVLECR